MSESKGIYWLSSYPKSGNTWFRIVLARLLNTNPDLSHINDIDDILGSPIAASRTWMNKMLGFESSLLTEEETEHLRPAAYTWHAQNLQQPTYIKIHDAYTYLENNKPLIPIEGCLGAIYFVRNPLDVAISLAHHAKCPIDWSIHMMGDKQFAIPFKVNKSKQLHQRMLTWSSHVQSWVTNQPLNLLVLRYEDMLANPLESFTKAIHFLKLSKSQTEIEQAIAETSFNKLQQFEKHFGFKEKPAIEGTFFRKGIAGDWKNTLNQEQINKIIDDHGDVMKSFGYLDEQNRPV